MISACECCGNDLEAGEYERDSAADAAQAKSAGVWVKYGPAIGCELGYFYFCSKVCGDEYARQHWRPIPRHANPWDRELVLSFGTSLILH